MVFQVWSKIVSRRWSICVSFTSSRNFWRQWLILCLLVSLWLILLHHFPHMQYMTSNAKTHNTWGHGPLSLRPRASFVFRIIISCTQLHTTTWTCPQPLKADRTEHTLTCLSLSCWRRCSSVLIWAAWAASVRPRSTATGGSAIVTVTVSQSNVIQKKHQTDLKNKLSKSLKTDFKQAVKVAQDRFQTSSQSPSRQNSNKLRQSHKHWFQTSCQSRSGQISN